MLIQAGFIGQIRIFSSLAGLEGAFPGGPGGPNRPAGACANTAIPKSLGPASTVV